MNERGSAYIIALILLVFFLAICGGAWLSGANADTTEKIDAGDVATATQFYAHTSFNASEHSAIRQAHTNYSSNTKIILDNLTGVSGGGFWNNSSVFYAVVSGSTDVNVYFNYSSGAAGAWAAGNDTTGNGTLAAPYKTFATAWAAVPYLVNADHYLCPAPVEAHEEWVLGGKIIANPSAALYIMGSMTTVTSGTVDRSSNTFPNHSTTIYDTSETWAGNAYDGMFINVSTASGQEFRRIETTYTDEHVKLTGRFDSAPAAGAPYTISYSKSTVDADSTRSSCITVKPNQGAVNIRGMRVTGSTAYAINMMPGVSGRIDHCDISGNVKGMYAVGTAGMRINANKFTGSTATDFVGFGGNYDYTNNYNTKTVYEAGVHDYDALLSFSFNDLNVAGATRYYVYLGTARNNFTSNYVHGGTSSTGAYVQQSSALRCGDNLVDNMGIGFSLEDNATVKFVGSTNTINNTVTTGIQTVRGTQASGTTGVVNNAGTPESSDAATYSYID